MSVQWLHWGRGRSIALSWDVVLPGMGQKLLLDSITHEPGSVCPDRAPGLGETGADHSQLSSAIYI